MSFLPVADRAAIRPQFTKAESDLREPMAFTKPQLDAAIAAADDWCDANAASFNTALPVEFRTAATARQKARLLMHVISKRFMVGV